MGPADGEIAGADGHAAYHQTGLSQLEREIHLSRGQETRCEHPQSYDHRDRTAHWNKAATDGPPLRCDIGEQKIDSAYETHHESDDGPGFEHCPTGLPRIWKRRNDGSCHKDGQACADAAL
jgi:hypothetical protein